MYLHKPNLKDVEHVGGVEDDMRLQIFMCLCFNLQKSKCQLVLEAAAESFCREDMS